MRILITGASRGLGHAMCVLLRNMGHHVLTPTRSEMNVCNPESISGYASKCLGPIDILINNAGGDAGGMNECLTLNAVGPWLVTNALWSVISRNGGRVINISSREGLSWYLSGHRPYSVSKAALNAITRMHAERAPHGVSVNACCPGPFDSSMPYDSFKAADTPIWMALDLAHDVTGKFFINKEVVPW